MIYDTIENIGKYKELSKWFVHAVTFLEKTRLSELPNGRWEICGSHVYANVMDADTVSQQEAEFEIHRNHLDIQLDIEGCECIQIGLGKQKQLDDFDEERDFGQVSCQEYISYVMGAGRFIVCMPEEPHRPTLRWGESIHVRKCVIKVETEAVAERI